MSKRQPDEGQQGPSSTAIVKRSKGDDNDGGAKVPNTKAIVTSSSGSIIAVGAQRTSDLKAPTMRMSGHDGNVTSAVFAPGGAAFASAGFDGRVLLWNTFGEIGAYQSMQHKKPVLALAWTGDGAHVLAASADRSVAVWDAETGARARRAREHAGVVSDVAAASGAPDMFASACDDGVARLWDARQSRSCGQMESPYQILAVSYSKDASLVYWAGIDDTIHLFDVRQLDAPLVRLAGHREAVTSLALSSDGAYLLSNARDNTLRLWDARPFSTRTNRCLKIFLGATHDQENHLIRASWSPDGGRVAAGSADRCAYVWDTTSKQVLYKLPGHKGVVNAVAFHPDPAQPVVLSASADKTLYLGELAQGPD